MFTEKRYLLKFNSIIVTRNGKIIWKYGPNWPFYVFMLRTKLYQSPFFFTGHQKVSKQRASQRGLLVDPYFYLFIRLLSAFFLFSVKMQKLCYNRLQFVKKKHKLTLHNTRNEELNNVDRKFFFKNCQEPPVQKLGDRQPNTIELASCLLHALCDFKAT